MASAWLTGRHRVIVTAGEINQVSVVDRSSPSFFSYFFSSSEEFLEMLSKKQLRKPERPNALWRGTRISGAGKCLDSESSVGYYRAYSCRQLDQPSELSAVGRRHLEEQLQERRLMFMGVLLPGEVFGASLLESSDFRALLPVEGRIIESADLEAGVMTNTSSIAFNHVFDDPKMDTCPTTIIDQGSNSHSSPSLPAVICPNSSDLS